MRIPALLFSLIVPLAVSAQEKTEAKPPETKPAETTISAQALSASLSTLIPRCVGPTTMGGRVADIAVYEKEPRIFYVASAEGGLWKTENDGTTFTPVMQKGGLPSMGAVAVSQKDPNLVWVGMGEPSSRNSVGWGDGVYKSTDGGKTWQHMGLKETMYVSRIVIDPRDNNTVYVGGLGNLWGESEERGLYKTTDGGKTWKKILYVDPKTGIGDLVMNPSNPNVLVASTWQRQRKAWDFLNGGPGGAIWRSTDAGRTWKKITKGLPPGPFGRIGLNYFRKDPRVMVATVEYRTPDATSSTDEEMEMEQERLEHPGFDGGSDYDADQQPQTLQPQTPQPTPQKTGSDKPIEPPTKNPQDKQKEDTTAAKKAEQDKVKKAKTQPEPPRGGTYLSKDGGQSWQFTNSMNPRAFYFSIPRYDPQDKDRIYLPGISMNYSEDGGKTFRVMRESVHVDHHAMWIDPSDSNHMIVGEDGGVGVTYDRGKTWRFLNNLPIGQYYTATYDMRKPYWVYGGLQDNGCWATPTQTRKGSVIASDSYLLNGGDGFYVQVDPTDWRTVFSESQGGAIVRTDQITGRQEYIQPRPPKGEKYRFNWNTPIHMSPFNPRTIYLGGNRLFRTVDRGDHWQPISPDLTTNDPEKQKPGKSSPTPDIDSGAERHCTIVTISESPRKQGLIWCGTDDGQIQLTQDGGQTWTNLTANLADVPKNLWVSRVIASKFNDGRAFVTIDGHRSNDMKPYVYMTDDFGKTWTNLSAGLPAEASLYVVQEGQKNEDLLFVGSEAGFHISLDRGKTWTKFDNDKFPTVPVYDLQIHPRDLDLIIATHGRSIWTMNIAGLEAVRTDDLKADAAVFKPKDVLLLGRVDDSWFSGEQDWISPNNQPGTEIPYFLKSDSFTEPVIVISDITGKTSEEFKAGKTAGLHAFVWNGRLKGRTAQPGDYRVTLKVGGKEYITSVRVEDVAETMN